MKMAVPLERLVPNKASFQVGSSGPAVKAFQLALAKFGYPLSGTGYFGTDTDTAVTAFQRLHGLEPDGQIGAKTARMLDAALTDLQAGTLSSPVALTVSRPLWLDAGLKLVGTHEAPGAKDNAAIIDWAEDIGGEIGKEYTHDSIPWCALFANYCLSQANLKGTGTLWALDFAGKWPSVRLSGPAVGAFAPMQRPGGGHIIQVVGRDARGRIMGLGGNQSDQVSIEAFPLDRLNRGFWWPLGQPVGPVGFDNLPVVAKDGRISIKES